MSNMQIKVALLASKFKFVAEPGEGVQRYAIGLWDYYRSLPRSSDVTIDKVGLGYETPSSGSVLKGMYQLATQDFSGYDILHTIEPIEFSPIRLGNAKVVTTLHDVPKAKFGIRPLYWVRLMRKYQAFGSDYIIAISSIRKKELVALGVDSSKVFIVNDGIESRFLSEISHKKENKKFVVGTLGALYEESGVSRLIKASKSIKSRDVSFEICGKKGGEYETLAKLAGPDDRIHFNGFIPNDKLISTFDSFDVYVSPTSEEGFGIAIAEAQARGLPVIVFKDAILPDEIRRYCIDADGEEDMAAKIEQLRQNGFNEKQRKKMTEYARQFTWENTAKKTLEVYRKIAGR